MKKDIYLYIDTKDYLKGLTEIKVVSDELLRIENKFIAPTTLEDLTYEINNIYYDFNEEHVVYGNHEGLDLEALHTLLLENSIKSEFKDK